jgi:ribonucleotide reductase alpha subunit
MLAPFPQAIYKQKYAWPGEEWSDTAWRVATTVLGALGYSQESKEVRKVFEYIRDRKFIPGGRYLYATGRRLHQTQNCLLIRAEDSREGWADIVWKSAMALQTGAGIGIDYSDIRHRGAPIVGTGGVASGPVELMKMVNEIGRGVMQGGSRRSAIWAGLNWNHSDADEFIVMKNWSDEVRAAKAKDFNAPGTMDMTNVSIGLDDDFFEAMGNPEHPDHVKAKTRYKKVIHQMFTTAEPGFSVNLGSKRRETLRNAPVAADTQVLTTTGWQRVGDMVDREVTVWTGLRWATTTFRRTGVMVPTVKVSMTGGREIVCDPTHPFILERGERIAAAELVEGTSLMVALPTPPPAERDRRYYTLGFVHGDGTFYRRHAEVTLCTEEKQECLELFDPALVGSVNPDDSRGYVRVYMTADDFWAGRRKDLLGSDVMSATTDQICSFIAGLFDADGSYDPKQHRLRLGSKDRSLLVTVQRLLEQVGILSSVNVGSASGYTGAPQWMLVINTDHLNQFIQMIPTSRVKAAPYAAYRRAKIKVLAVEEDVEQDVFCCDVGVEEHSFMAEGVIISNCTEVTSEDDSDICNLGSFNLARIESIEEFKEIVRYGTLFLLAGSVYSDVPYPAVAETRTKNRRLGAGLMGVHEWLLKRGLRYEPSEALGAWLKEYCETTKWSYVYAREHKLSAPIATRAIAPTGTIAIIGETTSGIEPIFCVAYKRRYLANGKDWKFQYVIDPTARRLIDSGVDPESIEDAYSLSYDIERRVAMQAWLQEYVDQAISSTINMPAWGTDANNESTLDTYGDILLKYLPRLRGITVYPDGCRGGQPLVPVAYAEAAGKEGVVFEESEERCVGGACGV